MPIPADLQPTPFTPRYPDGIEEWVDVYGHAVPLFLTEPDSEYDAVRSRVAALEYSMLFKWYVEGPDAIAVVDATVSRNISALRGGRLAYGVVVTDTGFMVDDVTVAVVSPEQVVVTGGNPETEAALRAAAPSGTSVTERRSETAVLSLQGPNSRAVLAKLADFDVSNEAFPYYTFRTGVTLAGVPATVNRVGFTAELGYELLVDVDQALTLWDAVFEAGADYEIQAIGAAALMMCRVEAGMIMGGLEYDDTVSPFECRMGWAVDFDKASFLGRDALAARKDTDQGRVVSVRTAAAPESVEGAPLVLAGSEIGSITMAVPSPHLGGSTLAMARVHRAAAKPGMTLTVQLDGSTVDVEVCATPAYDPERRRVRS